MVLSTQIINKQAIIETEMSFIWAKLITVQETQIQEALNWVLPDYKSYVSSSSGIKIGAGKKQGCLLSKDCLGSEMAAFV